MIFFFCICGPSIFDNQCYYFKKKKKKWEKKTETILIFYIKLFCQANALGSCWN